MTTDCNKPLRVRVGIIGGAGYTAGELLRLLLNHPDVEIAFIHSASNAGQPVTAVHSGLLGETGLHFSSDYRLDDIDVLFLCSAHGHSREFWEQNELPSRLRVIDLAQDYRDESCGYVYGLPEVNRDRIAVARLVANPGCFATAIQLALLPAAEAGLLHGDTEVSVTALTGSTGAGVKPGATTHFSWRQNNLSVYKPLTHQHLAEIGRTLASVGGETPVINFVPMRGDFARGIFAVCHFDCPLDADEVRRLYEDFYADAAFTVVAPGDIDLKQVVNTNKAVISVSKHGRKLLVCCAIDNLLKGASGQAVENMNIMLGLDRRAGLRLKPLAF